MSEAVGLRGRLQDQAEHAPHAFAKRRGARIASAAPRLLALAEGQLRRRLETDSKAAPVLRRLADTQRAQGQLAAARDSYRHLLALAPDPAVAWLVDVLGAEPLPAPPPTTRAVPFARDENFLGAAEQARLLAAVRAAPECFVPARVGFQQADPNVRAAFLGTAPLRRSIAHWFVPKLRAALPPLLARLASDCRGLRRDHLAGCHFETNVTMHRAGGFYQAHSDVGTDHRAHRRISFVCYFGREPRRFEGGDLLLYDTNYQEQRSTRAAFSRIAPLSGSLVIFPSDSYHAVAPVVSPSGKPLDFADCRFTVNGWIYAKRPNGDTDNAASAT